MGELWGKIRGRINCWLGFHIVEAALVPGPFADPMVFQICTRCGKSQTVPINYLLDGRGL